MRIDFSVDLNTVPLPDPRPWLAKQAAERRFNRWFYGLTAAIFVAMVDGGGYVFFKFIESLPPPV